MKKNSLDYPPSEYGGGDGGYDEDAERVLIPEVEGVLRRHVHDRTPEARGNKGEITRLGDALFGVSKSEIGRCDPSIKIELVSLLGGKSLAVEGPNGAGKSTLLDAIQEKFTATLGTGERGAYRYGNSMHARSFLRIARLEQEEQLGPIEHCAARQVLESAAAYFKAQLPVKWESLDYDVMERNPIHAAARARIEALMKKLVRLFEMEEFLDRPVGQLSGGERTKTAVFMLLLSEPDILLLDEPTNHLDLLSISKVSELIKIYTRGGMNVASISHVTHFLREAGRDGVVRVSYDGALRCVRQVNTPFEKHERDSSIERTPVMRGDIEWSPGYENIGGRVVVSPLKTPLEIPNSPLRSVKAFSVFVGDMTVVSGENGSGKTMLLNAMALRRKEGYFSQEGGLGVAYLPQFWPEHIAKGTLREFFEWVRDGINPYLSERSMPNHFLNTLQKVGFGGRRGYLKSGALLDQPLLSFSGGEQRLLWFLAVSTIKTVNAAEKMSQYVKESNVPPVVALFLDEPTNHMDQSLRKIVMKAILDFGGAVVVSTHDPELMEALSRGVGKKASAANKAQHYVLKKDPKTGVSSLRQLQESPAEYCAKIQAEGRRQARAIKVGD